MLYSLPKNLRWQAVRDALTVKPNRWWDSLERFCQETLTVNLVIAKIKATDTVDSDGDIWVDEDGEYIVTEKERINAN